MKKNNKKGKTDKKPVWIFLLIGLLILAMLFRTFKPNTPINKSVKSQSSTSP